MGSKLDSFDGSKLDGFIESKLSVRGGAAAGAITAMIGSVSTFFSDSQEILNAEKLSDGSLVVLYSGGEGSNTGLNFLSLTSSSFTNPPDSFTTFTVDITLNLLNVPGHSRTNGDRIALSSTNILPAGLSRNTVYFVIQSDAIGGTFAVSLTQGGVPVDITDLGSGTHRIIVLSPQNSGSFSKELVLSDSSTLIEDGFLFQNLNGVLGTVIQVFSASTGNEVGGFAVSSGTSTGRWGWYDGNFNFLLTDNTVLRFNGSTFLDSNSYTGMAIRKRRAGTAGRSIFIGGTVVAMINADRTVAWAKSLVTNSIEDVVEHQGSIYCACVNTPDRRVTLYRLSALDGSFIWARQTTSVRVLPVSSSLVFKGTELFSSETEGLFVAVEFFSGVQPAILLIDDDAVVVSYNRYGTTTGSYLFRGITPLPGTDKIGLLLSKVENGLNFSDRDVLVGEYSRALTNTTSPPVFSNLPGGAASNTTVTKQAGLPGVFTPPAGNVVDVVTDLKAAFLVPIS